MAKAIESPAIGGSTGNITVEPIALSGGGVVTQVEISNLEWRPVSSSPITNRRVLNLQNNTGQLIRLRYDDIPQFLGIKLEDGAERNYDVLPSFQLLARSETSIVMLDYEEVAHS